MIFRLKYSKHFIVCFTLLALSLRSLIPAGYMPDFSGHGKGLFPLVICDGYEHSNADPCPMHHSHDGHSHGGLCPFGASSISSYEPVAITLETHATYSIALSLPFYVGLPYKEIIFTNASPRSPPLFS